MNLNQEIILRAICAFETNGYSHFILSNLNSVVKAESTKKIIKELETLNLIKDETSNGYAKKIKILQHLECPEFIFNKDLDIRMKKYLLTRYKEYKDTEECITTNNAFESKLSQLGLTGDLVKNSNLITKEIHSSGELVYTELGYKIITYPNTKEYKCEVCGEIDPEKFVSGRKSMCKKCLLEYNRNVGISIEQKLLKRSSTNARNLNVEYNLDIMFIHELLKQQNNKCKYSGVEFGNSFLDKYTYPTLDRIDSSKGYTKDNVCLCTWYVNTMKNNASTEQFKTTIKQIYENLNNF